MWALIKIGLKESLRQRVLYFIFAISIAFIFMGKSCNPGRVHGEGLLFDKTSMQHIELTIAYHGLVFWSIMLCGLVSASVLAREMEQGTALLTLCRPIRRAAFIAGKVFSSIIISSLNLFLLGIIFFILYYNEVGLINIRIFISFSIMVLGLAMFTLMNVLFSLVLPRIVTPLVSFFVYLVSIFSTLPVYYSKLRIIWSPSEVIKDIYNFFPKFGDIQFIGADIIKSFSLPSSIQILAILCNICAYFILFGGCIIILFNKKEI